MLPHSHYVFCNELRGALSTLLGWLRLTLELWQGHSDASSLCTCLLGVRRIHMEFSAGSCQAAIGKLVPRLTGMRHEGYDVLIPGTIRAKLYTQPRIIMLWPLAPPDNLRHTIRPVSRITIKVIAPVICTY